ncbi:hypothetical protein IWW50_001396 [Coemansia erecta]|nr:hypothetical protein GGF43_005825 [Coemansia sp. RSA 2618]KAJ2828416.1 hypothetical protein IWW50_001396 [Coemansia erecta]
MHCFDDQSVRSFDTRYSIDSADSRACLLSKPDPKPTASENADAECRQADLEHIMAYQTRSAGPSMSAQRVVLTDAKRRDMQVAELAAKVGRMGRLRFANQDCAPVRERRASDIEGFIDRLDRLGVKTLADSQRYSPQPLVLK